MPIKLSQVRINQELFYTPGNLVSSVHVIEITPRGVSTRNNLSAQVYFQVKSDDTLPGLYETKQEALSAATEGIMSNVRELFEQFTRLHTEK